MGSDHHHRAGANSRSHAGVGTIGSIVVLVLRREKTQDCFFGRGRNRTTPSPPCLVRAYISVESRSHRVATRLMLTFISYWRAAAIVLNDLALVRFYACGIASRQSQVRALVQIVAWSCCFHSPCGPSTSKAAQCSSAARVQGCQRSVRRTLASSASSALMFDYILTGPISGVSAGQYIVGLVNETCHCRRAWRIPRAVQTSSMARAPQRQLDRRGNAASRHDRLLAEYTKGLPGVQREALRVMQITTTSDRSGIAMH